jgi:hypothetical protein
MGNRKQGDVEQEYVSFSTSAPAAKSSVDGRRPQCHTGSGYARAARSTADGDRLCAVGLNGDLVCLDVRSGNILWRHDFVAEFEGKIPTWGYTESPLVDGPWVVCTPGGGKATFAAFDKLTGKQVWGSEFGEQAGYASIAPAVIDDVKQYVQFMHGAVVGVDARNGVPLWRYEAPANGTANCSTVLVAATKPAASAGGTGGGAANIKKDGDKSVDEAFHQENEEPPRRHGPRRRLLYGSDDPAFSPASSRHGRRPVAGAHARQVFLIYFAGWFDDHAQRKGKVCCTRLAEKCEVLGELKQPDRSD